MQPQSPPTSEAGAPGGARRADSSGTGKCDDAAPDTDGSEVSEAEDLIEAYWLQVGGRVGGAWSGEVAARGGGERERQSELVVGGRREGVVRRQA